MVKVHKSQTSTGPFSLAWWSVPIKCDFNSVSCASVSSLSMFKVDVKLKMTWAHLKNSFRWNKKCKSHANWISVSKFSDVRIYRNQSYGPFQFEPPKTVPRQVQTQVDNSLFDVTYQYGHSKHENSNNFRQNMNLYSVTQWDDLFNTAILGMKLSVNN